MTRCCTVARMNRRWIFSQFQLQWEEGHKQAFQSGYELDLNDLNPRSPLFGLSQLHAIFSDYTF